MSRFKYMSAGVLDSGRNLSNKRKNILLAALASILLASALIGIIVIRVNSRNSSTSHNGDHILSNAHSIVKSSCTATLYPELCYSTITSHPDVTKNVKSQKDVIEYAVNITAKSVQKRYLKIKKLAHRKNLTTREVGALCDCLEMFSETLEELREVTKGLEEYRTKKSLKQHADDLKTLMSSVITDHETCLDGFSHMDTDNKVRKEVVKSGNQVEKMCSNVLAMICNMTNTDLANEMKLDGRKLKEQEETNGVWPGWLSGKERKLLQLGMVTPNVVVATDGSGDYTTVADAVAAAPSKSKTRYVIRIKAGVYRENVEVPKGKTNIMFVGDGRKNTIITGSRSYKGGSSTFNSATVAIVGDGFLARDITFQNTAGASNHQAVALRVSSDHSAFYQCDMLGYQDTLYVHKRHQFYIKCLVVGTIDFIFGDAEVVFQDCDIHARRNDPGRKNVITAQGRSDTNQNTAIVIQKCRIGASSDLQPVQGSFPTYLGRPWKQYSRTVIMQSTISNVINPAGWSPWDGTFALNTLYYGEYENKGEGARTSERVKWKGYKVINRSSEAHGFTLGTFLDGASWLPAIGFPFLLGL
ncbi:pectinesterase-like [Rutidosis leptorrhynchoides]|uniref:pectinesterase-like n=1 Tax=Rutidosis leptorrhynchoides TaxID=125765 RepID=UPI003A99FC84